jgi:hypothetical protein
MQNGDKEEILEAIGAFAEQVDVRFDSVDRRFEAVDRRFDKIEADIGGMKSDIGGMKSDIVRIESQMVTKSYLDDKLADLKGDMVVMLRTEDQKVNRLVGVLAKKGALTSVETRDVFSFRPFP